MIHTVIVIEDDKDLAQYLQDLLTENNYSVQTANTGVAGLKLISTVEPSIVLLDLTLPDMTGEGVCLKSANNIQRFPSLC
jgi:DNA-binding response OmpR family regulator